MRSKSGLLAVAVSLSASAPALAQNLASTPNTSDDLRAVAFSGMSASTSSGLSPASLAPQAGFQPAAPAVGAPVRWTVDQVSTGAGNGAHVDTFRLAVAEARVGPSAGIHSRAPYDAAGFDLSYTRDWPDAVQFSAGRYDLAVSPRAGLALTPDGAIPQAGATVRLGSGNRSMEDRLGDLVSDGRRYGDQGRWYLFAAARGTTVGLNMTRSDGGWSQAGWSTDKTSKLVGDGQLGIAYRKGAMQASFGYVYREIEVKDGPLGADTDVSDSMAAFSLTLKPNF